MPFGYINTATNEGSSERSSEGNFPVELVSSQTPDDFPLPAIKLLFRMAGRKAGVSRTNRLFYLATFVEDKICQEKFVGVKCIMQT